MRSSAISLYLPDMIPKTYDIIIIGAGPAGATLVSYLKRSGLSIAVIDKSSFPRDKVCGDAIPGPAVRVLEAISPETKARFANFQAKRLAKGGTAIAPDYQHFSVYFKTKGYISKRIDFDNFLFEEAQSNPNADFYLNANITSLQVDENKATVQLKGQAEEISAKILVGCDGANSIVARKLTQRAVNPKHHCGAVRAYYENVQMEDDYMLEFYFLENYLPGYFWVFPLENGQFNVGFGMLSKDIAAKNINLRASFEHLILTEPKVSQAFKHAQRIGPVQGFGLPLGSIQRPISGHRFLLCGDAASLIDPATGEGIGNAMISAVLAAQQIESCFAENRFDAPFLKAYDQAIHKRLGKSLRQKYLIQRMLKDRGWLLNLIIAIAARSPLLRKIIGKIF